MGSVLNRDNFAEKFNDFFNSVQQGAVTKAEYSQEGGDQIRFHSTRWSDWIKNFSWRTLPNWLGHRPSVLRNSAKERDEVLSCMQRLLDQQTILDVDPRLFYRAQHLITSGRKSSFLLSSLSKISQALRTFFARSRSSSSPSISVHSSLADLQIKSDLEIGANPESKGEELFRRGYRYLYGVGGEQNLDQAFQCFADAANQNHVEASYAAGVCCLKGIGIERNLPKAEAYFQKASTYDHQRAQELLIFTRAMLPHL